jgi:hypothetical protein
MVGACRLFAGEERFVVGNVRGKRKLERSGRRGEDNIKMDLQEV